MSLEMQIGGFGSPPIRLLAGYKAALPGHEKGILTSTFPSDFKDRWLLAPFTVDGVELPLRMDVVLTQAVESARDVPFKCIPTAPLRYLTMSFRTTMVS
jgi:hypothetical protein